MKKNFFLLVFIFLMVFFSHLLCRGKEGGAEALAQDWQWLNAISGKNVERSVSVNVSSNDSIVYVCGNFSDTLYYQNDTLMRPPVVSGSSAVFLLALNTAGNLLWSKVFYGNAVLATACRFHQGRIYVTGNFTQTLFVEQDTLKALSIGGISTPQSIFLACYDSIGNYIYSKSYGVSASYYPEDMLLHDTSIYISGTFSQTLYLPSDTISPSQSPAFFLLRLNTSGQVGWIKAGSKYFTSRYFSGSHLTMDKTNNLYAAGHFADTLQMDTFLIAGASPSSFVTKISPSGNIIFLKRLGENKNIFINSLVAADSVLYFAGYVSDTSAFGNFTLTPSSPQQCYLLSANLAGNFLRLLTSSAGNYTSGLTLSHDPAGNIYFAVSFEDTLVFLNTPVHDTTYNLVQTAIFKITKDTVVRYTHLTAGKDNAHYESVTDGMGNYYTTGYFTLTMKADTNQFVINGTNPPDGFIGKISCMAPKPKLFASNPTICSYQQAVLWVQPQNYFTYQWNNAVTDTLNSISSGGTYWVYALDENGCGTDTSFQTITQFPLTVISIGQVCDSLFSNQQLLNSVWYFGNTPFGSGNYIHTSGNGWYILQGNDSNGCLASDSINVNIISQNILLNQYCDSIEIISNGQATWYYNGIITDTGHALQISQSGIYYASQTDSLGCVWYSDTLNIEVGRKRNNIKIYPNPVKENLFLRIPQSFKVKQLRLYDMSGAKITEQIWFYDKNASHPEYSECEDGPLTEYSISLAPLQNGVYALDLLTDAGEFYFRVVKAEQE